MPSYDRVLKLAGAALLAGTMHSAWAVKCTPGPTPESWVTQSAAVPYPVTAIPNTITLIMFRHGEKNILSNGTFLENGNMNLVGQTRAQQLPERLQQMFGCPDYIVAPDPSGKIEGLDNRFYYYERPAGTIEPTAAALAYPLWTPYGIRETFDLADDLLTAPVFAASSPSEPKKVFIAWEHNNIEFMTQHILSQWDLHVLPSGEKLRVNGKTYTCEDEFHKWQNCDFDSIWVLNIQGNNVCYSHMHEHLNNAAYQKACKKAERRSGLLR